MFDFEVTEQGDFSRSTSNGIAVSAGKADVQRLDASATRCRCTFAKTAWSPMTVQAIYDRTQIAGNCVISLGRIRAELLRTRLDYQIFAKLKPGVTPEQGRAAIEPLLKPYPTAELLDQRRVQEGRRKRRSTPS